MRVEMRSENKEKVVLAKTWPLYTRSSFLDKNEVNDNLNLNKLVDAGLNEISSRGEASKLIFMDVDEFPDACKITGLYEVKNGNFHLVLKLTCGKDVKAFQLEASTKDALLEMVLKKNQRP